MIYEYENHCETSMQDLMRWIKRRHNYQKGYWISILKWKGSTYVRKEVQVK